MVSRCNQALWHKQIWTFLGTFSGAAVPAVIEVKWSNQGYVECCTLTNKYCWIEEAVLQMMH